MYYILDGKTPVRVNSLLEWSKRFEVEDRQVAHTERDGVCVSTVFLGLDHRHDYGLPILFETMIFGGEHDGDQWRYSTWDEAEKGHRKAVNLAFKLLKVV